MNVSQGDYVFRPLGLTIAIFSAAILFSAWPLVKLYMAWRLQADNNAADEENFLFTASSTIPLDTLTVVTGLLGLGVLVSAFFAWWGKPPRIQYVFQALVILTTVTLIGESIYRAVGAQNLLQEPIAQAIDSLSRCQIPLQVLTALYVVWYCNRAPARAFYRQQPLDNRNETK